jgi:hypothetical protein
MLLVDVELFVPLGASIVDFRIPKMVLIYERYFLI